MIVCVILLWVVMGLHILSPFSIYISGYHSTMKLTKEQLYADLHAAYLEARRHKRSRDYQQQFERDMYWQLKYLCDELYERRYTPQPATCFTICDPKKREIVAAEFRDRIVHHLYYSYTHQLFERTFIEDAYSCIESRGTHYGVKRLQQHIREESQNYTRPCYVLKMDIRGYFMGIDRKRLLELCRATLQKMSSHVISKGCTERWADRLDFDFIDYLTETIILADPLKDCICLGWPYRWQGLPDSKSLFHAKEGCGLPIGNLTSQLFSNVYLNALDQWMKRTMHCRHYGRYVDDFYVVSCDREWLKALIPRVRTFLMDELGLTLHEGKTQICNVMYGLSYLGAYIKPWRTYVSHQTLRRIDKKIKILKRTLPVLPSPDGKYQHVDGEHLRSSLSSILGLMRHHASWHLRERIIREQLHPFERYGFFDRGRTKFIPYKGI